MTFLRIYKQKSLAQDIVLYTPHLAAITLKDVDVHEFLLQRFFSRLAQKEYNSENSAVLVGESYLVYDSEVLLYAHVVEG